jgi:HEPN domain-containing protein
MHNPTAEAQRWWMQALDDRAFVRAMAREGRFFDKACFSAQHAAEKALKACLYAEGRSWEPTEHPGSASRGDAETRR